jgi:DNA-directed RNA polymerase subunit F
MRPLGRSTLAGTLGSLVLAAALGFTAGCDGCKGGGPAPQADAGEPHATTEQLTPELSAKVLAKVGDRTITLGDYLAALDHMDQFDRLRYRAPERRKELLEEMIRVELLAQEATQKGYDKDPVAQAELRAVLREAMLADARKGSPSPADIPEGEVRAYFDAHKADYHDPERRRVSCIVTKDETAAKVALDAARAATTAAAWGEVVRQRSTDLQARASVPVDLAGDFGIVSPPGDARGENARVPEEVRAAAFQIEGVGQVLPKVIKATGKYWVVRLSQKLDARDRTFAEAERVIRVKLAQDKIRDREQAVLAELKKKHKVEIDQAALATVRVDLADAGPR